MSDQATEVVGVFIPVVGGGARLPLRVWLDMPRGMEADEALKESGTPPFGLKLPTLESISSA